MPSLVDGAASGVGSCSQTPLVVFAVTTPGTPVTVVLFLGERCAAPWMSWIRVPPPPPPALVFCGLGAPVVKSLALLSLSAAVVRCTDAVLDPAGAGEVS